MVHDECSIPVVFEVEATTRLAAATLVADTLDMAVRPDLAAPVASTVRDLHELLGPAAEHVRVESWWFPEPELKVVDGNDRDAMVLAGTVGTDFDAPAPRHHRIVVVLDVVAPQLTSAQAATAATVIVAALGSGAGEGLANADASRGPRADSVRVGRDGHPEQLLAWWFPDPEHAAANTGTGAHAFHRAQSAHFAMRLVSPPAVPEPQTVVVAVACWPDETGRAPEVAVGYDEATVMYELLEGPASADGSAARVTVHTTAVLPVSDPAPASATTVRPPTVGAPVTSPQGTPPGPTI